MADQSTRTYNRRSPEQKAFEDYTSALKRAETKRKHYEKAVADAKRLEPEVALADKALELARMQAEFAGVVISEETEGEESETPIPEDIDEAYTIELDEDEIEDDADEIDD